jgi:ribosomal-protein-alanine N-acetyltransferase
MPREQKLELQGWIGFSRVDVTADEIHLDDLRAVDIDSILGWRYGDDYMSYELAGTDRSTLADPTNEYLAVRRGADLIGYVCLGEEARVAEMTEDPAVVDIGVGIRPDLTGRGESRWLMPAILIALDRRTGSVTLRAVVKE